MKGMDVVASGSMHMSRVTLKPDPSRGPWPNGWPSGSQIRSKLRELAFVVAMMSLSSFVLPGMVFVMGAIIGVSSEKPLFAMAIPYSLLLALSNLLAPPIAIWIGLLQGPLYGHVMIQKWPPRKHWRAWIALLAIHALASAAAYARLR